MATGPPAHLRGRRRQESLNDTHRHIPMHPRDPRRSPWGRFTAPCPTAAASPRPPLLYRAFPTVLRPHPNQATASQPNCMKPGEPGNRLPEALVTPLLPTSSLQPRLLPYVYIWQAGCASDSDAAMRRVSPTDELADDVAGNEAACKGLSTTTPKCKKVQTPAIRCSGPRSATPWWSPLAPAAPSHTDRPVAPAAKRCNIPQTSPKSRQPASARPLGYRPDSPPPLSRYPAGAKSRHKPETWTPAGPLLLFPLRCKKPAEPASRIHGCRIHGCRIHGCRIHGLRGTLPKWYPKRDSKIT